MFKILSTNNYYLIFRIKWTKIGIYSIKMWRKRGVSIRTILFFMKFFYLLLLHLIFLMKRYWIIHEFCRYVPGTYIQKKILYNCLKIYFVGDYGKKCKIEKIPVVPESISSFYFLWNIFPSHCAVAAAAAHVPFGTQNVTWC